MISAAAPYWVADTPIAAAIGPATSAPSGHRDHDAEHVVGGDPGQQVRRDVPGHGHRPLDHHDLQGDAEAERGHADHRQRPAAPPGTAARSRMAAPMSTTNRIGRCGLNRSAITPPTIRPTASAAVIRPQAAGAAEVSPGDHRPEHVERPVPGGQDHAVLGRGDPQPACGSRTPTSRPAVPGACWGSVSARRRAPGWPAAAGTVPSMPIAAGGQRPAGPGRGHEHPGHGGARPSARRSSPAGSSRWPPAAGGPEPAWAAAPATPGRRRPCPRRSPSPAAIICHSAGWPVRTRRPNVALADRDHQVGRDDHPLRRDPVRDNAADQREDQRRARSARPARRTGPRWTRCVQDRERHPDQRERERRRREQPVREQQPEVADSRGPETGGPARATA